MNRRMLLMLRLLLAVVLLCWVAGTARADGEGYMQLVGTPTQIIYEGQVAWEYWYDVYSGGLGSATQIWLHGFPADEILNPLTQRWDSRCANGWFDDYYSEYLYPAFGDGDPTGTDQWVLSGNEGEMLNPIHSPSEYLTEGLEWASFYPGNITAENELHYWWAISVGGVEGLYMTIRLVHPWAPGDITYSIFGPYWWDQENAPIMGPAMAPGGDPGDFDGDGDVDVDDINALCANMTGDGIPLPGGFEQYDLDNDGDADSADMDILIHDLVETTVGVGTEYGDFNLDGKIDTVDLTILGTYFGVGTSWSQGNANCDTTVDTVDLTILGTYFGFVASSPIPEPATMALLGCGAVFLIRKHGRA